jgi:hypothetical protein
MHSDHLIARHTHRAALAATTAVIVAACLAITIWQLHLRKERHRWISSVRAKGLQTFQLSSLNEPDLTISGAVCDLLTGGDLTVALCNDDDARKLLSNGGKMPPGTNILISSQVSRPARSLLAEHFTSSTIGTFPVLTSNSHLANGPSR